MESEISLNFTLMLTLLHLVKLVVGVLINIFGSGTTAYQVNYLYFPLMPSPCSFEN